MVKRVTPTEKAVRLLDLVPFIYSHQGIALADLATEFSITTEELISDLNVLWMCGESRFDLIELEFDSGFVYIRNAEAVNLVRSLSVQEMTAILFGLDLLKESVSVDTSEIIAEIELIKTLIGKPLQRSIVSEPKVPGEILLAIDSALSSRMKMKISYHSVTDDVVTERIIHPIERRVESGVDLLLAFCESADSHRNFRLDRIQSAVVVQATALRDPIANNSATQSVVIKVHGDQRRVLETLGPVRENVDGSLVIEIYSPAWLIREVIAAAGAIEVLAPAELRAETKRQIGLIAAQYR